MNRQPIELDQKVDKLLSIWRQDLTGRWELRETPLLGSWLLKSAEDCAAMYRALYFSDRRYDFYDVLFNNLDNNNVLKWLGSRRELLEDFLRHTAWKICTQTFKPEKLQFLISLFHPDLMVEFGSIINALNLEQCRHLMARTASTQLRELLKEREIVLNKENPVYNLNIWENTSPSRPYPTLHGEKYQLWREASRKIKLSTERHYNDFFGLERFHSLLESCDFLYRCGLVEDALLTLGELYITYQRKNRLVSVLEDSQIFKYFTRLNRSILPMAVLLNHPHQAYQYALFFWEKHFARLPWDSGSMLYLDLLETVNEGLKSHHQILWEVLYKSDQIRQMQPGDAGPLHEEDIQSAVASGRVQEFLHTARERLASRPHESLTILEMLRLLHKQGKIANRDFPAPALMESYLELWQWLPSKLFFNRSLEEHLAPLLDRQQRSRIKRLAGTLEQYDISRLKEDLSNRPELFRNKDAWARRQVMLGHVLGVLS